MTKSRHGNILLSCIRILMLILLSLALGYGLLLTVIGTGTERELDSAKSKYAAITVQITELRQSPNLSHSLIVVLKPEDNGAKLPEQLGQTIATTSNQKLTIGNRLTMYYDPNDPQARVIDFQTAKPMQTAGLLLTGSALLLLLRLPFPADEPHGKGSRSRPQSRRNNLHLHFSVYHIFIRIARLLLQSHTTTAPYSLRIGCCSCIIFYVLSDISGGSVVFYMKGGDAYGRTGHCSNL